MLGDPPLRARCARRRRPAGRARPAPSQPRRASSSSCGRCSTTTSTGSSAQLARAAPRTPVAGQSHVRARPRPSGPAAGHDRDAGTRAAPWTNAVVQEPCTCQSRILIARHRLARRAPRAGRTAAQRRSAAATTAVQARVAGDRADARPGSPRRARRWSPSSTCGTRHGAQRAAGTIGANSETTGVPTAAARWAGPVLPTTTASAPASTAASSASVGPAAEVDDPAPRGPATARGQRRARPAPPVTTTRRPAAASARDERGVALGRPTPRAGTDAPGCTTTYGRAGRAAHVGSGAPDRAAGRRRRPAARSRRPRPSDSARSTSWTSSATRWPDVEQRARVVLADRGDRAARRPAAAAARSAAGSGGTR